MVCCMYKMPFFYSEMCNLQKVGGDNSIDPTPTLEDESDGNYPNYLNYRLFFRGTPLHP